MDGWFSTEDHFTTALGTLQSKTPPAFPYSARSEVLEQIDTLVAEILAPELLDGASRFDRNQNYRNQRPVASEIRLAGRSWAGTRFAGTWSCMFHVPSKNVGETR